MPAPLALGQTRHNSPQQPDLLRVARKRVVGDRIWPDAPRPDWAVTHTLSISIRTPANPWNRGQDRLPSFRIVSPPRFLMGLLPHRMT